MNDHLRISTGRQKELLAEIALLLKQRAATETELVSEQDSQLQECTTTYQRESEELKQTFESELKALDDEYVSGLETARHRYETQSERARAEAAARLSRSNERFRETFESGETSWRQTRALIIDNFESEKRAANEIGEQTKVTLDGYEEQLTWLEEEVEQLLARRGVRFSEDAPSNLNLENSTAVLLKNYSSSASNAHNLIQQMAQWRSAKFLDDGWPLLIFFGTFIAAIFPSGVMLGWTSWHWLAASAGAALVISLGLRQIMRWSLRVRARGPLQKVNASVIEARSSITRAHITVEREQQQRLKRLERRRVSQLEQADLTWKQISEEMEREHKEKKALVNQKLATLLAQYQATWDAEAKPYRDEFPPKMQARKQCYQEESNHLRSAWEKRKQEIADAFDLRWDELVSWYNQGMRRALDETGAMYRFCDAMTVDCERVDWSTWDPPVADVSAIRFGEFAVDLTQLEGGLSDHPRMQTDASVLRFPSVLAFPETPSLLVKATDEGRDEGIRVVRNIMLRMLTSLPPGKVRFTIIDPTGLGQNFSEFMHLADYDERLVSNRIWTESIHINQRLADLTEHMENVIQKYLRNEYASIQEYNAAAGEIAEPFQVLVIANFPANVSEEAARRLVSVVSTGARCGVYTLAVADTRMDMPRNFDLADLQSHCNALIWNGERLEWEDASLRRFPLTLDPTVQGEALTEAIRAAGDYAKDANRVEVPFTAVAPQPDAYWTHDSRHELVVPLGRAGATKLQELRLGKGTSQHVLVAGKTGSGKSTMMHAMITNLALLYSTSELEFFLVDFKKGVEFKTYAQFRLPHARVVAIESEREFGLSVLQRLDEELKRRGDLFRDVGVQSVAGFREARPDDEMPRQLLVVDEFQEFFVKDDKIASDASLLLDRLVRQGRAFGIHVLLGSQTLAGAYSLARSTLGQMAVRIALQCSESDAHLILSEDNTAARLLSRPGEAIYNNANGLFEGNHPFQVVWLPDSEREEYLRQIESLARERQVVAPPAVVFEGSKAANPADNVPLVHALTTEPAARLAMAPKAWLGAPIAIKEPAHAVIRRQSGSNLLVVGQHEALAAGVMANALISLAACQPMVENDQNCRRKCRWVILDGGGFEAEEIAMGSRLRNRLPLNIASVELADVETQMQQLAEEVTRRIESKEKREPIYVAIYNLARFRQLRKSDDDFGLGSFGGDKPEKTAAESLAHLLREGPGVGVHAIIWCDTYNNVTRWFDRGTLRDFAHRVLFQMSATDSSNLMDAATASQLGAYRGIYYSDEQGEFERFCPYGAPENDWLDHVATLLHNDEVPVQ